MLHIAEIGNCKTLSKNDFLGFANIKMLENILEGIESGDMDRIEEFLEEKSKNVDEKLVWSRGMQSTSLFNLSLSSESFAGILQ